MGTTTSAAAALIGGDPGTIASLVLVDYTDAQRAARMCSGTVIAQNIVLTAAHCADGNTDSYAVYTQTQLRYIESDALNCSYLPQKPCKWPNYGTEGREFESLRARYEGPA